MDRIRSIDVFPVAIPRDTPYLGLREQVNEKDYFIHPGNKSIYSIHDQSLLVRVTSEDGAIGWGEAYGMFAPQVAATILRELVIPQVTGRDPHDVIAIHDDLYDMMRVRGYLGGYYLDALAGIDIALWDLRGKLLNLPLAKLLGAARAGRPAGPGGASERRSATPGAPPSRPIAAASSAGVIPMRSR